MVIGSGLLATTFSEFKSDKKVLIFASGVSNSNETDPVQFVREEGLLRETITHNPGYKFVYFSTTSVTDSSVKDRPYVTHKLAMEEFIQNNAANYLIFRVSNVVGPNGNVTNIMNFLVNAVKEAKPINIWAQAERNFIDKDDILFIVKQLLKKEVINKTVNIALKKSVLVSDVVMQVEKHLNTKAIVTLVSKGSPLAINVSDIKEELEAIEVQKGSGDKYISNLLKKYH